MTTPEIRFQPGTIVATLGALQVASHQQIAGIIARHLAGDWGEVGKEDAAANERALRHGMRLLSSYTVEGQKLWVSADRPRMRIPPSPQIST